MELLTSNYNIIIVQIVVAGFSITIGFLTGMVATAIKEIKDNKQREKEKKYRNGD